MNKILKITGNSGLIDLLAVLEYGIIIAQYCDVALAVEWTRWENTFDKLITCKDITRYTKIKDIPSINSLIKLHANDKIINKNTPLSYYSELFNQYNLIELWDNRTLEGNYPSVNIFDKISFSVEIDKYKEILGEDYVAFHGRFTDFPYDKEAFLKNFKNNIEGILKSTSSNILLCTDNQELISEYITNKRIFNFSYIKELLVQEIILPPNKPTHGLDLIEIPNFYFKMQTSAIIDLLLCIDSSLFYYSVGGYSKFIKDVRRKLLNNSNNQQGV